MSAEFRHLDGAQAGEVCVVRKDFATIGRHPSADVRFDAERDLDVSGRHAAVFRQNDQWVVRDLGSTNGTWINGARIKGDHALRPGDELRFGANGPRLTFQHGAAPSSTVPPTQAAVTRPIAPPRPASSTTGKIRVEVRRQTAAWKRVTMVALVTAAAAASALVWTGIVNDRAAAAERDRLLARTDTLMARMEAAAASAASLSGALSDAQAETRRLRGALATRDLAASAEDSLTRALSSTLDRHEAVTRAAELDAGAIAAAAGDAVALLVSEFPGGRRVAGTAFAVRVRGDTGWVLTSRHLVVDSTGRPAARLGLIFNGSRQNFRAELLRAADSSDLALLTVVVKGGVPAVKSLARGVQSGEPVVMLGFPFGLDFPVGLDWRKDGVRISRFSGTARGVSTGRLEIDGYGASGSSGSPVFNAAGEVVGVVFGGDPASGGRTVYAVPLGVVQAMLAAVP